MIGQVLTLSALVALGQTKAIVTNNCRKDVYIWSVPERPDLANNLSISPGKRYEEPWRSGTGVNPGVAIKVSTGPDGIYANKSEIDFQYDVDPSDPTQIWIDLTTVRGHDFDSVTLNSCQGALRGPNVPTRQCSSTDDVELILCGSERTIPSRDSTPPHVISNCIKLLAERDDPQHARSCSGRVVGPKRIPMPPDEQADECLAGRNDTVPLKTVMRMEAAKHAASQAVETHKAHRARTTLSAVPGAVNKKGAMAGPLCDLLHRAWPDAQCDESMAEHNAKLFYQDNCGKKTRDMFPGTSCELIRHEMERIYPEVVAKRELYNMCIHKAYRKLHSVWSGTENHHIKDALNGIWTDRTWTSDENVCADRVYFKSAHERRCVLPYCKRENGPLYGKCSDVEDALEEISKDAGKDVDWTSSDEECRGHRAQNAQRHSSNSTAIKPVTERDHQTMCIDKAYRVFSLFWGKQSIIKKVFNNQLAPTLFTDRSWTSDEELCNKPNKTVAIEDWTHKEQRCVKPFCDSSSSILPGDCSDVEAALQDISRDAGKNIDWTTEDDVCDFRGATHTKRALNNTTAKRNNDVRNVCVIQANEKLGKYWGADATERIVEHIFPDVRWTSDSDECSPQAISESKNYHHKLIDNKQGKEKYCVFNCEGKTCKRVKNELNKLSKDVGKNWSWTDDEKVCGKAIDFGEDGPLGCSKDASARLGKYWGSEVKSELEAIFSDRFTDNDDVCSAEYVNAAKKYFHDHTVKLGKRCVSPHCKPFNADCSDVEDELEKVSKDVGLNIDWTTDDDACPPFWKREGNSTRLNKRKEILKCAKPHCQEYHYSDDECLQLAKKSEEFMKTFGYDIKYTIDEGACQNAETTQLPSLQDERSNCLVCSKQVCLHADSLDYECQEIERRHKAFMKEILQVDIDFTDSDDVCGPSIARAAFDTPIRNSTTRQSGTFCSKAYCAPRIPGVDCAALERDISGALAATSSDAICHDDPLLYRSVLHDEKNKQKVCVRKLCGLAPGHRDNCHDLFQGIEEYYKKIHNVNIRASIDDDVCGK
ncbi:hypothetical protein N0V90_007118 [Kalmusia sp. IMI 367209]|nr:hypothetical protein N0V90_007118 [Kalmusia sp. IMI 367209]